MKTSCGSENFTFLFFIAVATAGYIVTYRPQVATLYMVDSFMLTYRGVTWNWRLAPE